MGTASTTDTTDTGMRLYEGEDWPVPAINAQMINGAGPPCIRLRRIGWLDQKGRVWLKTPPSAQFDGGSLTPLLIDPRG